MQKKYLEQKVYAENKYSQVNNVVRIKVTLVFRFHRTILTHQMMAMKMVNMKSISARISTELRRDLSCPKKTGRGFQSTHSPAVADY